MAANDTITLKGYDEVVRSLTRIEPEIRKTVAKSFRSAGHLIARDAESKQGSFPHNLGIGSRRKNRPNAGIIKYRVSVNSMLELKIKSPTSSAEARAATIAEFAGKKGASSPQGRKLVSVLSGRLGSPGRVLWASFDELWPEEERNVQREVDAALASINKVTS
jgi:hypothetical protein